MIFKKCKDHLCEAKSGYVSHLIHSIYQSNRLIAAALKSYIHGFIPCAFKADAPKTVIRMYHEIKRIRHLDKLFKDEE